MCWDFCKKRKNFYRMFTNFLSKAKPADRGLNTAFPCFHILDVKKQKRLRGFLVFFRKIRLFTDCS